MKINIGNENVLEDITNEEENIYQKLARATARAVDINLGKTTLADLLDGYTKSRILQQRIDKAIEYMQEAIHSDSFTTLPSGKIADISDCIVAFEDLLEILGDGNNE